MPKNTAALIAGPSGGLVAWLAWGAIGPAAVGLPVNWAAEKLASAAVSWFKRIRKTDDLSRMVKTATGTSVDLSDAEFKDLRKLLAKKETWSLLAGCEVKDLVERIAACLPSRDARAVEDSREAAWTIARGLLEFAVFDLEPGNFQNVVLARLQQMADKASALDKALYDLHAGLYALYARVDDVADLLKRVMERLQGPAEQAEIVVYLTTLVNWLNTDPWPEDRQLRGPALTPAAIERKLRITAASGTDKGDIDADTLAQQCRRLIILGGPGSGKTWLAKRTARHCAKDALEAITAGRTLDEVEPPLYTSCAHLFNAAADKDIREAAVSSALSHIGDFGGSRITRALRLFFTDRNAPTVLVIDSLDEARGSDAPLAEANSLPWRIILTSRPGSWNGQLRIEREDDSHRVGELQPLRYPDDVRPFIQRWFDRQPEPGQRLAAQIAQRPDLQQAATVPLLLAFYCIIGGDQPLPGRRAKLYTKVIHRMLTGRWRGDGDRDPDPDACLETLRDWAWSAAVKNPVSGLGAWTDEFPTPRSRQCQDDRAAMDHVAVPMGRPDPDNWMTQRRFVHRSIREHLVAEHVALRMPTAEAAQELLNHVWYDPDWEYVAPAALAMHPQRDQVLIDLVGRIAPSNQRRENLADIDGCWEIRRLLARVALESAESDWMPEAAEMIGQARLDLANSHDDGNLQYVVAADWPTANSPIRQSLLDRLAVEYHPLALTKAVTGLAITAEQRAATRTALLAILTARTDQIVARDIASAIAVLDPSAEERAATRAALLAILTAGAGAGTASELAETVAQLAITAEERTATRTALLAILGTGTSDYETFVEQALPKVIAGLAKSAEERAATRAALLALLAAETYVGVAENLAEAIAGLDPSAEERTAARAALFTLLAQRRLWGAQYVAEAVTRLAMTAEERATSRAALLARLAIETDSRAARGVTTSIAGLDPSAEERATARAALLALLTAHTDSETSAILAKAVTALADTAEERAATRKALLALLAAMTTPWGAQDLAAAIAELDPSPEERATARTALLALLAATTTPSGAQDLAAAIAELDPSPEERATARTALLALLATDTNSWIWIAKALTWLSVTAEERAVPRAALLALLATETDSQEARSLVEAVTGLDPPAEERAAARTALLALLATETDSQGACSLVKAVTGLDPPAEERAAARTALLALLATETDSWEARGLAEAVMGLDPQAEERAAARTALLALLATESSPSEADNLTEAVAALQIITLADLDDSGNWLLAPVSSVWAAARQNTPLSSWLAVLPLRCRS